MNANHSLAWGAALAGLGVAAGAFGAHALEDTLTPSDQAVFDTAVTYQLFHSLAVVLCSALGRQGLRTRGAVWCFVAGVLIFSGSLYAMVLTGARWLGAVTPIGGTLFLIGWLLLALQARNDERTG